MTTTLIGLLAGSAIILLDHKVTFYLSSLLITVSAGTSATILLLLYLSLRRGPAERLIDWVLGLASSISRGRLNIAKWRERILNVLRSFHQGIDVIRAHPRNLIKPVIFSVLSWFFYLSTYHMVFYALGLDVPFAVSMVVFSISVAVQTVPVGIPVGLVEIVMTTLYTLFNIDIAISGTATTLIRVVTFWFRILIGYAAAQWIGVEALLRRS
ncbi:MAG: membrane protein [Candidatus Bathyarchaeota archaeon B26-1]|nr:MAG: membrane protein [Candidatus Bathyarchaeota archaeon B26-1]